MDARQKQLASQMHAATSYAQWRDAAEELDRLQGWDDWKDDETSDDFDWRLIRSRLRQIRRYREEGETARLIHHLRQGLHWNLGNIGNPRLYAHARVGTKKLVGEYAAEVSSALSWIAEHELAELPHAAKLRFFQDITASYGRSALMLSGGATLGLFHVGVVKALFRENLVPPIMSGSSAGSVVCATLGTRAAHEVEELLDPESAYYHFWRILPLREIWRRRALMDQDRLRNAIATNVRDLTFEQAYQLSGRVINVTVSPAGVNQPPRLLNHLTFPYLYVREAVLASCAVPLLFPPVMLMTQDERNARVPYMPLLRWNDGSLKSDLPTLRLRRLHNVNHFIVSQTNPHVLPFVTGKDGPGERGIRNAARDFLYSTVRGQTKSVIDLVRQNLGPTGVRRTLDAASSILDQDYRGNINITPEVSLWRYANVTTNPSMDAVKRFMLEGERATWPRIEMIRNQTLISQTLDQCVRMLEQQQPLPGSGERVRRPELRVVRDRGKRE